MGFFSSKKIVAVASVAYNLAGELDNRADFRRALVTRNILSGSRSSIADDLVKGYRSGPGMRLRRFFQWSQRPGSYDQVGCPTGEIESGVSISPSQITSEIPHEEGEQVWVQKALVDEADYGYWAEQWILENRREELETEWTVDYDADSGKVVVTFVDATTAIFTPINFDNQSRYVYAYYVTTEVGEEGGEGQETLYSDLALFIYRIGSGNVILDNLVTTGTSYNEFFPFIPVRLQNEFLSTTHHPLAFEQTTEAYKKATGGRIDDLVALIEDNENLAQIDNAYVAFGVPLNVHDQAARRYLYRFFDKLRDSQIGGPSAYASYIADVDNQLMLGDQWLEWKEENSLYGGSAESWINPEPPRPVFRILPDNQIRINSSTGINSEYDVRLNWRFIVRGEGFGLAKVGAKPDELWIEYAGEDEVTKTVYMTQSGGWVPDVDVYQKFRIYWQRTDGYYSYLEVIGMIHQNFVHGGKAVKILPKTALEEVEETPFIIPLHYDTWREIPLADATQMATECMFVVFNCYEIHKQRWYERGIFKILLIIVIAIASVLLTGGAGIGLLGAHLSVGVSLGFTGMMAAVVGSVVNALAAVIVTSLIQQAVGDLGLLGQIIGAVLIFVVGNFSAIFQNGGSLALNWGALLRADKLLELTSAIGGGVANALRQEAALIGQDMSDYLKWAEAETKKIQQEYFEEFGYGGGYIDPFMFVSNQGPLVETSDTFLTRTLMTGSDIAEMTQELLSSFPELSLKLPDAYT